ncbi:ABC transporter substrate-binding protein [Brevibacillus fluminis]|uniref:ABC transporter substrate-binding protein n=1 Tax=Brevibacillus fluminis TaxID=511487 RepID=A0A3M8DE78_9BACL|nr:ABC transporter substrate-binding protein [Brevibacillus fluminis]RNB85871.1 ABC transporter substrate-binding protein [Brevibacillus fluminis]
MRKSNKALGVFLSVSMMLTLAACGAKPAEQPQTKPETTTSEAKPADKTYSIGISQFVEHPALDAIEKGIVDGLAGAGYEDGKNVKVELQNAHADMSNTVSIAQKFAGDNKDMVIAIATPTAQAAAKAIADKPVIFSAVTDPIAAGLVGSLDKPDKNVTGTSDKLSMKKQLELVKGFLPNLKKLGVLYTTSEVNSGVQVQELEDAAKEMGVEIVKAGVSTGSEVQLATQSLVGKADAVLIPVDNTVVSAVEGVLMAAEAAKLPVFASDTDTVKRGAIATYGIDYYKMGKQTGEMAARILGGQQITQTPVEVSKEADLYINEQAAAKFGLTIPEDLKKAAKEIVK